MSGAVGRLSLLMIRSPRRSTQFAWTKKSVSISRGSLKRLLESILRSEEHTSELQSHVNLVCRLLLEKKKETNSTAREEEEKKETSRIASAFQHTAAE